jgi:hypothetical protein
MRPGAVAPAPAWRRMVAGAIDIALHYSLGWCVRRLRRLPAGWRDVLQGDEPTWIKFVGPGSTLVQEQLGAPGQRMLGIRTVDRRTGARVPAWKSLVLAASSFGAGVFVKRGARAAMSPERVLERQRFMREWKAIAERHANDPDAREAARDELAKQYRGDGCAWRFAALALVGNLLRRRLAPTTEVSVRRRA